jgi:hypothetical protein
MDLSGGELLDRYARLRDSRLDREMLPEPVVQAFLLSGIDDPVPANFAGLFVIFRHHIRASRHHADDTVISQSSTVKRVVNCVTINHLTRL